MATSTFARENRRDTGACSGFSLRESTRELLKGDACIRLQEQPFQILELLLERPGELVTRDDLRDRLWPDGTFVDFEHSLNAAIKRLRAVLGDDAKAPRFIETVPRRGYRWMTAPIPRLFAGRVAASPPDGGRRIEVVWT